MGKGYRDNSNKTPANFITRMQQDRTPVAKHACKQQTQDIHLERTSRIVVRFFYFPFYRKGGVCYEVEFFLHPMPGRSYSTPG